MSPFYLSDSHRDVTHPESREQMNVCLQNHDGLI